MGIKGERFYPYPTIGGNQIRYAGGSVPPSSSASSIHLTYEACVTLKPGDLFFTYLVIHEIQKFKLINNPVNVTNQKLSIKSIANQEDLN